MAEIIGECAACGVPWSRHGELCVDVRDMWLDQLLDEWLADWVEQAGWGSDTRH